MLMDKEQIKEVLPHREPLLLVDQVEEMEVGNPSLPPSLLQQMSIILRDIFRAGL